VKRGSLGVIVWGAQSFSPKLALFYVGTIGAVVGLFMGVTSYGETHLRAAPKIQGRYRITSADGACLVGGSLVIEQSGVYVNAALEPPTVALAPASAPASAPAPKSAQRGRSSLPFSGLLQNQRLVLTAATAPAFDCVPSGGAASLDLQIQAPGLVGTLQTQGPMSRQVPGGVEGWPIGITAQLEPASRP
jgi:hypothetical protein